MFCLMGGNRKKGQTDRHSEWTKEKEINISQFMGRFNQFFFANDHGFYLSFGNLTKRSASSYTALSSVMMTCTCIQRTNTDSLAHACVYGIDWLFIVW